MEPFDALVEEIVSSSNSDYWANPKVDSDTKFAVIPRNSFLIFQENITDFIRKSYMMKSRYSIQVCQSSYNLTKIRIEKT